MISIKLLMKNQTINKRSKRFL